MAAAPVNSWAARRAALPAWLRERRRTEYRRDRRSFAAGVATGGAVAVVGVAIAAVALLFTGHQQVQTPNLVGPAQGSSAPASASSSPSSSPSTSPSATTSPSSSPSTSPSPSLSPSPSPSASVSSSATASPTPSASTSSP
jgi:cytoskeletal protein RodZ